MFPSPDRSFVLYAALESVIQTMQPKSYMEIGVQEGCSLGCVLNADTAGNIKRLALCDNWSYEYGGTGRGTHHHIAQSLEQIGFKGDVEYHDGDSKETVPQISGTFDLILVDGDHSALGCLADMENAWEKLSVDGVMVVDDLIHPAHMYTAQVVQNFIQSKAGVVSVLDMNVTNAHGVAVFQKLSIKGDRYGTAVSSSKELQESGSRNRGRSTTGRRII